MRRSIVPVRLFVPQDTAVADFVLSLVQVRPHPACRAPLRGLPCRAGYHAVRDTVPRGILCRTRPRNGAVRRLQRLKAESSRRWARAAAEASALARVLVSGGGSEGDCAYERRLRGPQVRPCGW